MYIHNVFVDDVDEFRTGRQKRGTLLRDNMPAEDSVRPNTASPSLDHIQNGETAAEIAVAGETEGRGKMPAKIPSQTLSGHLPQSSTKPDEYRRGSGRGRRTGNKSSRGKDPRYAGAAAKQVREKPTAGAMGSRRSEITQRPVRNEACQVGTNDGQGAVVSRVIYTSDRRTRTTSDSSAQRLTSSSTPTLTVVTTG